MKIDARVDNHNPVPCETLTQIIGKLHKAERHHAIVFVNHAQWKTRSEATQPGWVHWHDGLFVNPLDGGFFYENDLDVEKSSARLLQPEERLVIAYHGESVPDA